MTFPSVAYLETKTYLRDQIVRYADKQPDCSEVHLPCCVNKQISYDEYSQAFQDKGMAYVSRQTFCKLWADHFENVKVRKVSQILWQ